MDGRRRVLISGASIAGPVLAYWLHRYGVEVTVVERAASLRASDGGHPVDLFGPAVEVIDRMGLFDQVYDARTRIEKMTLARPGRSPVSIAATEMLTGISDRHIEVMRGDLARMLFEATRHDVRYVFGTGIESLVDGESGVEVTLLDGTADRFDYVVGADGLHSGVRSLVFGDESAYRRYLGGYLAVYTLPDPFGLSGEVLGYSEVDAAVAMYPTRRPGRARVLFLFRREQELTYDYRDDAAQRSLLREHVGHLGWAVPDLLGHLDAADDFYFDSISQITMDTWSLGRVTLVGDAGYGPGAAVGGGTSLAAIGAYVLATELAAAGGEHTVAFPAYQRALAEPVRQSRRIGPHVLNTLIPRSRLQVWMTLQAMRLLPKLPAPLKRKLTSFGGGPAAMLRDVDLRDPDSLAAAG